MYKFVISVAIVTAVVTAASTKDKDSKKDGPTKRQDDLFSAALFGGWRPIKPGSPFFHGSQTGKFHDLISTIPEPLDTSSTYYSSSYPNSDKDIYNYYPRPAIKPRPKSKAPVYMENFRRKQRNQKQTTGPYGDIQALKIPGLESIDLAHLKQLQEVLLSAHHLPLSQLSLPLEGGKGVKFIEISLQPLHGAAGIEHPRPSPKGKSGYGRPRPRRNRGGVSRKVPAPHMPPLNVQYLPLPALDVKPEVAYGIHKDLPILPVQVPGVEEIIDVKNVQIVEVPLPVVPHEVPSVKSVQSSEYGQAGSSSGYPKGGADNSRPEYAKPKSKPSHRSPGGYRSTVVFPPSKSSGPYAPVQQQKSLHQVQYHQQEQQAQPGYPPQIEAELVEITEDQIKSILKSIQSAGKDPNEVLSFVPLSDIKGGKSGEVHLVLAVPQTQGHSLDGGKQSYYEVNQPSSGGSYGYQEVQLQVLENPGHGNYESSRYPTSSEEQGSHQSGYGTTAQKPKLQHLSAGYQVEGSYEPEPRGNAYHQPTYPSSHDSRSPSSGNDYGQDGKDVSYQQQEHGHQVQSGYQGGRYPGGAVVGYKRDNTGQAYIEVHAQPDQNGYRREPVLALELKKGQTVEDAIQALDPETLQKLGAHSKDGVEIEVVEIPVDEYASESRKKETVVSKSNSTATERTTSSTTTTTTVAPS